MTTLTITEARPETLQQRREALDDIARRWDDKKGARERARKLKEITGLHGEARRVAMQTLIEAIEDADKLESGEMTWDQYEPDLSGQFCDKQEQALIIAWGQVYDAMNEMLRDPVVTS
jgi:hypothetical protein